MGFDMRIENAEQVQAQLKAKLPEYIEEMVGRPVGRGKFLCPHPDHDDVNPNACLNPKENFEEGKCFSCGANFDIFTVAHWNEGLPAMGAEFWTVTVRELASRYDIKLIESEISDTDRAKYAAYRALRDASSYVSILPEISWGKWIEKYVSDHEWSKTELGKLGVGVGNREGLVTYMQMLGYSLEYLNELDLVRVGNATGTPQIIDEKRLVFTIYDAYGRTVGFASRGNKKPKFLNSPESPLYKKFNILYGIHWARKHRRKPLYVFEGYTDVITAIHNGIENVCATCGTALTAEQLLLIKELGFQSIVLCFDNDKAGIEAVDRALEVAKGVRDLSIKVIPWTDITDKDPDEFIRGQGPDAFRSLPQISGFSWMLARKQGNGLTGPDLAKDMTSIIATEPNAISREVQVKELALAANISMHSIETEVRKLTDIKLEERRKSQNAIIERMRRDLDSDPNAAITIAYETTQALEKISKDYDSNAVNNSSFLSMIELQQEEEKDRADNDRPIGFEMPLLPGFQKRLEGGDSYTAGTLFLLGGLENTGKSSFLSYWGMNVAGYDPNDTTLIIFSIDDTGKQILPKLVCSADSMLQGRYNREEPLTIGNVRNPKTIQSEAIEKRRAEAYDMVKGLAQNENIILKDARDGNTLSYIETVVRYHRRRHPSRRIIITVDNTHNLGDFPHMDDRSERYKRIAGVEKSLVNRYDAMMFATVEYRKVNMRESRDIVKMIPNNEDIAETRALKYLSSFIGHLYNDIHSRPNLYDTFHVCPKTGIHLPRIIMNVGKTKINGFKGSMAFDFYPASSAFVGVENREVKLQRTRYVEQRADQAASKTERW